MSNIRERIKAMAAFLNLQCTHSPPDCEEGRNGRSFRFGSVAQDQCAALGVECQLCRTSKSPVWNSGVRRGGGLKGTSPSLSRWKHDKALQFWCLHRITLETEGGEGWDKWHTYHDVKFLRQLMWELSTPFCLLCTKPVSVQCFQSSQKPLICNLVSLLYSRLWFSVCGVWNRNRRAKITPFMVSPGLWSMIYTSEIIRMLQDKHWRRKGVGGRRALQGTIRRTWPRQGAVML